MARTLLLPSQEHYHEVDQKSNSHDSNQGFDIDASIASSSLIHVIKTTMGFLFNIYEFLNWSEPTNEENGNVQNIDGVLKMTWMNKSWLFLYREHQSITLMCLRMF